MRLQLVLVLLQVLITCTSLTQNPPLPKDYSVILSYLSNQSPELSNLTHSHIELTQIEYPVTVLQFSSSIHLIEFSPPSSEYKIRHLSLISIDFSLEHKPVLNYTYKRPILLEIEFRPQSLGIKSGYLAISASGSLFIYHLIGTCLDSGFNIPVIHIYHEKSSYGVSELSIFNPFDKPIERVDIRSKHKKISIEKTRSYLPPHKTQEIGIIRSYFNYPGDFKTFIEVFIGDFEFYVPVYVKVHSQVLDIIKKLDFGIVTFNNSILNEDIFARSFSANHIKITSVISLSKYFTVKFNPKNVPALIEKFPICTVKFHGVREGNFVGKVEITTTQKVYIVECFAIVNFEFIYLPQAPLVLNPSGQVSYMTEIRNSLGVNLVFEQFNSETREVLVYPKERNIVEVVLESCKRKEYRLTSKTSLGKIYFTVSLKEPSLKLHKSIRNQFSEIKGPVVLGPYSRNSNHTFNLVIENINQFPVTVSKLSSPSKFSYSFQENFKIQASGQMTIKVFIHVLQSINDKIKISTSIGDYFVHISYEMVKGNSKVRALYFSNVMPLKMNEGYIHMINDYPVPIEVLSISSNYADIQFDIVSSTVPSQKEIIISKASFITPLEATQNINFDQFITYGEIFSWKHEKSLCRGFQEIFEVFIETDLIGLTKIPVIISYSDPQFPIHVPVNHQICQAKDTCEFFVTIENPFPFPVVFQLIANSQSLQDEIDNFDCSSQEAGNFKQDKSGSNDDYDFNDKVYRKCQDMMTKEVEINAVDDRMLYENIREDIDLIGKIAKFLGRGQNQKYSNLHKEQKTIMQRNSIISTIKTEKIVQSGQKVIISPILFSAKETGDYNLPFIIRNNFTIFQNFDFHVKVTGPKFAIMKRINYIFTGKTYTIHKQSIKKEQQKLLFHVVSEEFQGFYETSTHMMSPTFIRVFEIHNMGDNDLEIEKIVFENGDCSYFGFFIDNCQTPIVLKPAEVYNMKIRYNPGLFIFNGNMEILVYSSEGFKKYEMDQRLPEDTGIELFLYWQGEELLILTASILFSCLSVLIKSGKTKKMKLIAYSSQDLISTPPIRLFIPKLKPHGNCKPHLQSNEPKTCKNEIILEPKAGNTDLNLNNPLKSASAPSDDQTFPPLSAEAKNNFIHRIDPNSALTSLSPPTSNELPQVFQVPTQLLQPSISDSTFQLIKTSKFKKPTKLPNVIKSEPKGKNLNNSQTQVIANNKLLLSSKRIKQDEPAPHPGEAESEDDFYLDSYKTHNVLFGLGHPEEGSVLQELMNGG